MAYQNNNHYFVWFCKRKSGKIWKKKIKRLKIITEIWFFFREKIITWTTINNNKNKKLNNFFFSKWQIQFILTLLMMTFRWFVFFSRCRSFDCIFQSGNDSSNWNGWMCLKTTAQTTPTYLRLQKCYQKK